MALGNRADVYATLTDRTLRVAAGASTTVGATVVRSTKGLPFTVLQVSRDNFAQVLGAPERGDNSCYHLDAFLSRGAVCNVVRVVDSSAQFPSISQDTATGAATTAAHNYGTTPALGVGTHVMFVVKTGEIGDQYGVEITNVDATEETLDVKVYETNAAGIERVLEKFTVSPNPDKRNADGEYMYVPNLIAQSRYIDAYIDPAATIADFQSMTKTYFTGGSAGGTPLASDYVTAIDYLRAEGIDANLCFTGSDDSTVIQAIVTLAEEKYGHAFIDVPVSQTTAADAVTWAGTTLGIKSARLSIYLGNFSAYDRFYGGQIVCGTAGSAAAACAYADRVVGLHGSPAGADRGKLNAFSGVQLRIPLTVTDLELLAENRINPVVAAPQGGVMINDAWTRFSQTSVQEQIHVSRISGYVIRTLKRNLLSDLHSPQGDELERVLRNKVEAVMQPLQKSGALVETKDGGPAYVVEIMADEIETDLYRVRPFISMAKVARRIELEVILVK